MTEQELRLQASYEPSENLLKNATNKALYYRLEQIENAFELTDTAAEEVLLSTYSSAIITELNNRHKNQ